MEAAFPNAGEPPALPEGAVVRGRVAGEGGE